MNQQSLNQEESLEKLGDLIRDIKYCMLTTVEKDGSLRSRPMYTQEADFDGELWFFTSHDSAKVEEIEANRHVSLSYVSEDQKKFVSVSGEASLVHNREKMKELWKPFYRAWHPYGLEDPELCLLRVKVEYAEYWESPSQLTSRLTGLLKNIADIAPEAVSESIKISSPR